MSLQDGLFSEDVEKDIKEFIGRVERKRVLVFPPVNNYRRFLIHHYVQNQFDDLLYTFSIGQGGQRRTVVCYKTDVIRDPKLNGALPGTRCGVYKISDSASAMGVEGHRSPLASSENSRQRQVKSVPSIGIYRPPPARKARCDSQTDSHQDQPASDSLQSSKANRQKRPDRAVYVPRHRRSGEAESSPLSRENSQAKRSTRERRSTTSSPAGTSSVYCGENSQVVSDLRTSIQSSSSGSREEEVNGSDASTVLGLDRNSDCEFESSIKGDFLEENLKTEDISISEKSSDFMEDNEFKLTNEKLLTNIERDDFLKNYSDQADQRRNENSSEHTSRNRDSITKFNGVNEEVENSFKTGEPETVQTDTEFNGEFEQSQTGLILDSSEVGLNELETSEVEKLEELQVAMEKGKRTSIEEVEGITKSVGCEEISSEIESRSRDNRDLIMSIETNVKKKETKDEIPNRDEFVNHKNRRIIRQNLVSDVLLISDEELRQEKVVKNESSSVIPSLQTKLKKVKKVERPKSKPAPPPLPPSKVNRDECDWDSLFDDNGDCLDPTLIEELTTAVGEVTIEQPRSDYRAFSKAPIEVSNDEFAHVVEIYNFPSDFKTSDLAAVFSPFRNGGFELKWVDDTHCLGVFSSPLIAAEVLASDHSFVKTRPLSEATALSKTKARRSAEFLQPYRARPETCAALARRLVTGALGVRLATARQEREREKIVLREAKEKRRLANKQRKDAWDGVITEK